MNFSPLLYIFNFPQLKERAEKSVDLLTDAYLSPNLKIICIHHTHICEC